MDVDVWITVCCCPVSKFEYLLDLLFISSVVVLYFVALVIMSDFPFSFVVYACSWLSVHVGFSKIFFFFLLGLFIFIYCY